MLRGGNIRRCDSALPSASLLLRAGDRTGCVGVHGSRIGAYESNSAEYKQKSHSQHDRVFSDALAMIVSPQFKN
jgi:hypothetical protein